MNFDKPACVCTIPVELLQSHEALKAFQDHVGRSAYVHEVNKVVTLLGTSGKLSDLVEYATEDEKLSLLKARNLILKAHIKY